MNNKEDKKRANFIKEGMNSDIFLILINIVRIVTLIGVIVLIFIMISNIQEVKFLGSDVCKLCMEKTGCTCACLN